MTGIYNTAITFYILFPPIIPVAEVHFCSGAIAQENAFVIHQVNFLKNKSNKKFLVHNEQVKQNALCKNAQDKNKAVAFCVELKMKAAPFQVELDCKLWI